MAVKQVEFKHWQTSLDEENVLWLGIDRFDKSANSLSQETINELREITALVKDNKLYPSKQISGLVIYSCKESGFIAGADVNEFKNVNTTKSANDILSNGQTAMAELEELKIPTLAMIDGFCLGGGCELALACNYRVASDEIKTKIGLPEIMLGIVPGWGGTVRLARLIGGTNALPLIMQGRTVSSRAANKLGLVDACVPVRQLRRTAKYFITNKPKQHKPSWLYGLLNHQPFRNIFSHFALKELNKKVSEQQYPAPFKALENWRNHGVEGTRPFKAEIEADLMLTQHPTARNLIRIFFLQESLKESAKQQDFDAKHVHVIGGGTMGGDIAAWCAFKGMRVTLQDQTNAALTSSISRAYKLFKKKLKKDDLAKLAMDRITPDVNGYGLKSADVIIEAVFEDLTVKQELFKKIENVAKKDAIIATNTSSIPLDEINLALKDKSRLVGIHFFNPVAQMMLVEVVKAKTTSADVCSKAASFVNKIGKLPIPVSSSPGFLVNRVLASYMHETFIILSEGVQPEVIDSAMKKFGMPMGPVEMADIVGLDICLSVANNISSHYNETVPELLTDMVTAKKLGKKTGLGFYKYKDGKIQRSKIESSAISDKITQRLTMRILNTCVSCIRDKVVTSDDLVDTGLIFGAGFAPFRGGPMNYLNTLGKDEVIKNLKELELEYGVRFKPDDGFENVENHVLRNDYEQACGQ